MLLKVFFLAFYSLSVTSSPVCKCDDGPTTAAPRMTPNIVDFKLRVQETGEEYTETIEVDESKQTEVFSVPAHPGIDRSDVMHDFKLNLTLLRFPESYLCYLLPLDKEQPNPQKLIEDQIKVKGMRVTVPVRRKDTKWEITEELWDRSTLSNELAGFCAKYRIYRVKQIKDSLLLASIEKKKDRRQKRSNGVNHLCSGGLTMSKAYEQCDDNSRPKKVCKVVESSCSKYYYCPNINNIPLFELSGHSMSYSKIEQSGPGCKQTHIWEGIVCCEYICFPKTKR